MDNSGAGPSVIIPCRDAGATLPWVLDALARQTAPAHEVIVVDDGSSDGSARAAQEHPVVSQVVQGEGAGPARARNAGAAAATGDVLVFLDADCSPTPDWLAAGLKCLATADLVQGMVVPDPRVHVGAFDKSLWVTRETGLFESASLFVRREAFDAVGGFESWLRPRTGIELGEDTWFGWSARRRGFRTAFCAHAVAHHAVFRRSARAFVQERRRLRHFPAMARRMPEMRDAMFHRRWFLTPRSAMFDAAVVGVALAATRRPAGLVLAAPYVRRLGSELGGHPPRFQVKLALAVLAADAVGLAGLVRGSIEQRTLLL